MCGLCGILGFIGPSEKRIFSTLQTLSQVRGRDSTGVAIIPHVPSKDIVVAKSVGGHESLAVDHESLFDQDNWQLKASVTGRCVIGHHRYATSGIVNDKNAHPFDLNNIVGCHNGTVFDYQLSKLKTYNKDLIDSQVLLSEIDSGIPVNTFLNKLFGAWALVWWDKTTDTLNMCRNTERPLYVAKSKDQKTLFWASEAWMLNIALLRAGIQKDDVNIEFVKENKHLIWGIKKKSREVELLDSVKIGRALDSVWGNNNHTSGYGYQGPKTPKKINNKNKRRVPVGNEEIFVEDYVKACDGQYIKRREFEGIIENGCGWCGEKNINWENRETITWYATDMPVCETCENGETAARKVH